MIHHSPFLPLLEGYRGQKGVSIEELLDVMQSFSQIVLTTDRIDQFEINPIIATSSGIYAVDPKMILT
jgi:acetyltransferase